MAPALDRIAAFFKRGRADTFLYQPLDEEASQIRLLTLRPGSFSARIHVDLQVARLTPELRPRYEALSYTWGSTEDLVDIFVGPSTKLRLAVTRNLVGALRYLRYPDRGRVLWADAVCVNQKDLHERSRQVKRMASVFRLARRVVVWLGEPGDKSAAAIECLKLLSSKVDVSYPNRTMKPASSDPADAHWANMHVPPPFDREQWSAIITFLSRTWFERLWVWQEIRLADQDAVMICGYNSILWESFRVAVYCLYRTVHPDSLPGFDRLRTLLFYLCDCVNSTYFLSLAEQTKLCKCTDPKDRVYALLSMLPETESPRIEPDYANSFEAVYREFFMKYSQHSGMLSLLPACELREPRPDMPTWVPDLSIPTSTLIIKNHSASASTRHHVYFLAEGILKVQGLPLGTIQRIDPVRVGPKLSRGDFAKELWRLMAHFNLTENSIEAFCGTICLGSFAESFDPPLVHLPNVKTIMTAFHEVLVSQPDALGEGPEYFTHYFQSFVDLMHGRSLFASHDGHFGLAPAVAKEDDIVCILLGCQSPMILRPTPKGQFQVVGEAYYHGYMDGEALLGPFPRHFGPITALVEQLGTYRLAFYDDETDTLRFRDPRLGPLPTGWRGVKDPDLLDYIVFKNDEAGSEPTAEDPRLTPEAFRERGVDLRDLELI